eukprot:Gb_05133 [translate_table: standard]
MVRCLNDATKPPEGETKAFSPLHKWFSSSMRFMVQGKLRRVGKACAALPGHATACRGREGTRGKLKDQQRPEQCTKTWDAITQQKNIGVSPAERRRDGRM